MRDTYERLDLLEVIISRWGLDVGTDQRTAELQLRCHDAEGPHVQVTPKLEIAQQQVWRAILDGAHRQHTFFKLPPPQAQSGIGQDSVPWISEHNLEDTPLGQGPACLPTL